MSDKTLLQEARDALNKEHGAMAVIADSHPNMVLIPKSPSDCEVCQLILRLDSELAKVAEPVVLSQESKQFLLDTLNEEPHHGWDRWRKAREELMSIQPVVLDLRVEHVTWKGPHVGVEGAGWYLNQEEVVAAIRAQLPGVVVKC